MDKDKDKGDVRTLALLSVQRALWGRVTPNLRGVGVSWSADAVRCRFVYSGAVDEELELLGEAETEMIADMPGDTEVAFTVEVDGQPGHLELASGEWWAYLRYE